MMEISSYASKSKRRFSLRSDSRTLICFSLRLNRRARLSSIVRHRCMREFAAIQIGRSPTHNGVRSPILRLLLSLLLGIHLSARAEVLASGTNLDSGHRHWAFQPVTNPPLPSVKLATWVKSPIDTFILAKLEAHRLRPAPRADKRALIRRATFGLTGLPPTPD